MDYFSSIKCIDYHRYTQSYLLIGRIRLYDNPFVPFFIYCGLRTNRTPQSSFLKTIEPSCNKIGSTEFLYCSSHSVEYLFGNATIDQYSLRFYRVWNVTSVQTIKEIRLFFFTHCNKHFVFSLLIVFPSYNPILPQLTRYTIPQVAIF